MTDPLRVAVVGATGYAGFELARLLLRHPKIEKPVFYLREGHAGVRCLTELYPQLRGWGEAPCKPLSVEAIASSGAQVVFLSTPHEASLELVPALLADESCSAHRGLQRGVSFPRAGNISRIGTNSLHRIPPRSPKQCTVCLNFTPTRFPRRASSPIPAAIPPP